MQHSDMCWWEISHWCQQKKIFTTSAVQSAITDQYSTAAWLNRGHHLMEKEEDFNLLCSIWKLHFRYISMWSGLQRLVDAINVVDNINSMMWKIERRRACYCYSKLLNDRITFWPLQAHSYLQCSTEGGVAHCLHLAKKRREEERLLFWKGQKTQSQGF